MAMQCRCCLSTKATEFVDMASSTTDQLDFFHCFNVCTQLEARVDDVLPGMLCGSCCYDLQVAYHFVQMARQGDAALRESMLLKQKHWEESPTMTEIVEVETAEAEAEMDRLEYVNGSETEECVVEELLEEDEEGPLMHEELMEVEAVEEESLDDVGYMDVKPPLGDLDETTPAPQNDVTIKEEQVVCCAEDEADDEYLIEYNAEEATAVRDATTVATASGAKWKCVQCKRVLRGDVSYEGHMNMHRDMRPYRCWQCSCAFRCKNALTRHTEQRHNAEALPPQLSCELCHLRFAQESELQQHQQFEHTSQNRCEKCPKTLESAVALAEHNELTHGTSSIVECRFCPQMTTLPRAKIAEHYRNAHPVEHRRYFPTAGRPVAEPAKPTPWQCDICKRYMRSDSALRDHRNTHLNERPHSCQCCSKRFATSNNLRQHMRSVHPEEYEKLISEAGDIVVQCEVCKKQLLRRNLEKHVALHEKKKREASEAQTKFLCAYCSRECKNQKSLSQHEKMHESESPDVTYICADCDRSYATQHLLQQHRKQAHKERDNFCPICGNAFKLRNQLLNHMKLHLEKNIQCPQCDKRYARKFDLDVHMRSHTGEMPYACHLCEKRFAIKVRLTYHLQKHYGIKHRCKECGAEFNSKQKLKAHSYKHTGMPYRCETCDGHGFTNRDAFKRHLLRVHGVTMTEEALLEMFQQNTGKSTRIRPIDELENVMIRTSQVETASTTATITEVLINAEDIGMATEVVHA